MTREALFEAKTCDKRNPIIDIKSVTETKSVSQAKRGSFDCIISDLAKSQAIGMMGLVVPQRSIQFARFHRVQMKVDLAIKFGQSEAELEKRRTDMLV